jgi:hypothetical protein
MTIERFAELSGLLADPFADRAGVLSSAGLDAARWRKLEAEWSARLQGPDSGSLSRRFSAVYSATLRSLAQSLARTGDLASETSVTDAGSSW